MNKITRTLVLALIALPLTAAADTGAKTPDTTKTTDTAKSTDKTTTTKAKPAKLKDTELQVMAHYHAVNQLEIDLGNVAAKKGTTDGVKSYGKMLVKDHTDADKQLTAIAKKTGQMIPKEKPADDTEKKEMADDKAAATKLKTMKGADFDREYLRMMVQGHEKELSNIDANVAKVENADLADLLKAIKPTLQQHADQAKSLQSNQPTASNDKAGDMGGMHDDKSGTDTGTTKPTPPTAKR